MVNASALKNEFFVIAQLSKLTVQYNTTWDSTTRTKLQKTASKQRKTLRIVTTENTDIWEIMFRMKYTNLSSKYFSNQIQEDPAPVSDQIQ